MKFFVTFPTWKFHAVTQGKQPPRLRFVHFKNKKVKFNQFISLFFQCKILLRISIKAK